MKAITIAIISLLLILTACETAQQKTEEPLKIGAIFSLTGGLSLVGQQFREGFDLAIEDINAQGGINGKQVKGIVEDTQTQSAPALTAAKKLVEVDGAKAITVITTAASSVVAPYTDEQGILTVYESGTGKIGRGKPNVFGTYPDFHLLCSKLSEVLIDEHGFEKFGIVGTNGDFLTECANGAQATFAKKAKGSFVVDERFDSGVTDFKTGILKVTNAKPDGVFLAIYQNDAPILLRQMKELNAKFPMLQIVPSVLMTPESYKIARETDLYKGAWAADNPKFIPVTQKQKEFAEKYKTKYGKEPEVNAARGYMDLMMMAEAFKNCPEQKIECTRDYLSKTSFDTIIGTIKFDNEGLAILPVRIMQWDLEGKDWKDVKVYEPE